MKLFKILKIKNLSIYQLTLFLLLASSIISVFIVFAAWVITKDQEVKNQINQLRKVAIKNQEKKLKSETTLLINYLEFIQQDTLDYSIAQMKDKALVYFSNLRFGNDGYVFVNTYDGKALLFDGQKLEESQDISDLTDPDGFRIFDKELELAKLEEGGSFQYLFKKIYTQKPEPKLSYVKGFEQWNWIVGVGDYLDNLEYEINRLEQEIKTSIYNQLFLALGVLVLILMALLYISSFVAKVIQNQFNEFVRSIKQNDLGKKNNRSFDTIFINELKAIALDMAQAESRVNQFGNIIEQSQNEIYIFNQDDLRFVHANKGAKKNCGYSMGKLLKMTPLDLMSQLNKTQFLDLLEPLKTQANKQIHFETVHQRKDKSVYPVVIHLAPSIFNEKPVYIAFIYDISLRKEVENKLKESNERFINLFNNAPISLWEEDFTEMFEYLNSELEKVKIPIEQLLEQSPEVLIRCSQLAKVIDVNKYTLDLYEAESKEELLGSIDKIFTSNSFNVFKNSLIALHKGKEYYSSEGKNKTLKGKDLNLLLRWSSVKQDASNQKKVIVSVQDLTDLHKTEQELKASESRFRAIFDNDYTVMFLINPENGRFIDVNPAAIKFYGYSYDQFLNNLFVNDLNTLSKEETLARMEEAKLKKSRFFNFKHRLANGEIRDVEVYSGPLFYQNKTILFSIVHDVTEKKNAERALLEAKNKMESIFRAAPTGIGVVSERLITEVNEKFCEITGFSAEELIGKESVVVYPSREEFEWVGKEKYKQIAQKGTGTVETQFKRKDGKIIDVLLSSTPIDKNDLTKGVTFTALDISKRIEDLREIEKHRFHLEEVVKGRTSELENSQLALLNLVDDLNRQSEKLEQSNKRLAQINEELETFTYSVSHDLKAPLRGIDGYGQLLSESLEDSLDEDSKTFLSNIRNSTQQMNLLIEDLLSYSRLERRSIIQEPVKITTLIDSILRQYQVELNQDKIEIVSTIPENLMINTDKESLMMVMRNLIDNAIKFSAKSENPKIEIGNSQTNTETIIFVKDNGIGFDMKYHDRIFKIFQRLHLPEEYDGTGIGLALVSKAVQRMHGKIRAESERGKGACFYVEIRK